MSHRFRCKTAADTTQATATNNKWQAQKTEQWLGSNVIKLSAVLELRRLQATAPTTEPAMTPGDAAPLEEPDDASVGATGRGLEVQTAEAKTFGLIDEH